MKATTFGFLFVLGLLSACPSLARSFKTEWDHVMYVTDDGRLWSYGTNRGQLGLPNHTLFEKVGSPVDTGIENVASIGGGDLTEGFTVLRKKDGSLWGLGGNYDGQLGVSARSADYEEQAVFSGVGSFSCGGNHSVYLKSGAAGELFGFGSNSQGQLGRMTIPAWSPKPWWRNLSDMNGFTIPPVAIASGVRSVSAGGYHTCFIKNDGSLWVTGGNFDGQLGVGTNEAQFIPVRLLVSGVAQVSAGAEHTLFVKEDGSLWGMGNNNDGRLGLGDTNSRNTPVRIVASGVKSAFAGYNHSLYLTTDNKLHGMGSNQDRKLGVENEGDTFLTPVEILKRSVLEFSAQGATTVLTSDGWLRSTMDGWVTEADGGASPSKIVRLFTPEKIAQTIKFGALGRKRVGDKPLVPLVTASSSLAVTLRSSNTKVARIENGRKIRIVGAGKAVISANQAGNDEWGPAPTVQRVLTVAKGRQTISFIASSQRLKVGAKITAKSSSGLRVTLKSSNKRVGVIKGNTARFIAKGNVKITGRQKGNRNFMPASKSITVQIKK